MISGIQPCKATAQRFNMKSPSFFMETYNYNDYKAAGIDMEFVQDNQSSSKKGVLRGLHFQINFPQDKLVRVLKGEVYDVAVDLRPGSATYGKWHGVLLSEENKKQLSADLFHLFCHLICKGIVMSHQHQRQNQTKPPEYCNSCGLFQIFGLSL